MQKPSTRLFTARSNTAIILVNFTNCSCCARLLQAQQPLSWGAQLHMVAKVSPPLMLTGCLCSFIKGWGGLEDPDLSSSCSHQLYATLPFIGCGLEEGLKILSQGRLEEMGSIYGTRESPYPYWVKAFQVCAWKHLCSCKSCFGYALYGRKPSKLTGPSA